MRLIAAALRSAPGAVENRCPPKSPRPPAAGGGVNEPEPRPRLAAVGKKEIELKTPLEIGGFFALNVNEKMIDSIGFVGIFFGPIIRH